MKFLLPSFLYSRSAFSLIELSVVVSILAASAIGFLNWTSTQQPTDSFKNRTTFKKMIHISEAIESFRVRNGRLPCPGDPFTRKDGTSNDSRRNTDTSTATDDFVNSFGMEDLDVVQDPADGENTATLGIDCASPVGIVPINSLEIEEKYVNDEWGRRFTYRVSDTLCGSDTGIEINENTPEEELTLSRNTGCTSASYNSGSGNIQVLSGTNTRFTNEAAYAIVSHGVNGFGAFLSSGDRLPNSSSAGEIENHDGDNIFAKFTPGQDFDDILLFRTRTQIENKSRDNLAKIFSVQECEDIATTISNITLSETSALSTFLNNFSMSLGSLTTNGGGQVALGILMSAQNVCVSYYGANADSSIGWSGAMCPGNNNPTDNGSTYFRWTNSCSCASGLWDGGCTMDYNTVSLPVRRAALWLDSNDQLTMLANSNCSGAREIIDDDAVGCWKDKSANNRHASSTVTSENPIYQTDSATINSRPVLTFDSASNQHFDISLDISPNSSPHLTSFVVFNVGNTSADHYIYGHNGSGFNRAIGVDSSSALIYLNGSSKVTLGQTLSSSSDYILTVSWSSISSQQQISAWLNGTNLVQNNSVSNGQGSTLLTVGGAGVSSSDFWNGAIGEVIIYDRLLSKNQRQDIEEYLSQKWGVTL